MNNTRKLTFAAICSAIIIVILFLGAYIQTGTLAIYFISSMLIMIVVEETDKMYGLMAYIISGIIVYLLLPDKAIAISYVALFGIYGIIKSIAEKVKNMFLSWVLKVIFFNLSIAFGYSLISLFTGQVTEKFPIWALWLTGNITLVLYDIFLSFGINYYHKFIADKIKFIRK